MSEVALIRKNLRGIEGVFLIKEGEVVETDIEPDRKVTFPSWAIHYLLDLIRERKNVRSVSIIAENWLFIFIHNAYVLGIITLPDVNMPLLRVVAKMTLERARLDKVKSAEVARERLPEDQILVSRLSANELSELPDTVRSLLELVNGKRTLRDIVKLSDLPLEQVVEFIHNYRRTGKLLGIKKGFNKESVSKRLRSQDS